MDTGREAAVVRVVYPPLYDLLPGTCMHVAVAVAMRSLLAALVRQQDSDPK